MDRVRAVALGETALTAVMWGSSFPAISFGIRSGLDPELFMFLRFAVAGPLMLAIAWKWGRDLFKTLKNRAIWVLAFLNAGGTVCQFVGLSYTDASTAALLINLSVLVTAVGSAAFLKEKLGVGKSLGVAAALVGAALLTTGGSLSKLGGAQLFGDSLYILAAFVWGAYLIYNKKKTDQVAWDPLTAAATTVFLTAIFLAPVLLLPGLSFAMTPVYWEVVAFTAILNTAVPFVLYQSGLRFLTATSSAMVLMLEDVTAVVVSVLFLGDLINGVSLVGVASILLSIILVSGIDLRGKTLSVGETTVDAVRGLQYVVINERRGPGRRLESAGQSAELTLDG